MSNKFLAAVILISGLFFSFSASADPSHCKYSIQFKSVTMDTSPDGSIVYSLDYPDKAGEGLRAILLFGNQTTDGNGRFVRQISLRKPYLEVQNRDTDPKDSLDLTSDTSEVLLQAWYLKGTEHITLQKLILPDRHWKITFKISKYYGEGQSCKLLPENTNQTCYHRTLTTEKNDKLDFVVIKSCQIS